MYIFYDTDAFSKTKNTYCIREGSISYDGYKTFIAAIVAMQKLMRGT